MKNKHDTTVKVTSCKFAELKQELKKFYIEASNREEWSNGFFDLDTFVEEYINSKQNKII